MKKKLPVHCHIYLVSNYWEFEYSHPNNKVQVLVKLL